LADNSGHYQFLNAPGASFTNAQGLNNSDQVVGAFSGVHGYLYDHGTFHQIDVPGAAATGCGGINNEGHIVGGYSLPGSDIQGGFLYKDGAFIPIDFPSQDVIATFLNGINDAGAIVGTVRQKDSQAPNGVVQYGFMAIPSD
jgi:probable HAF family extracellular repeat protein